MANVHRIDLDPHSRLAGGQSSPMIRDALVLGALESGFSVISAGLARLGVSGRLLQYSDPMLRPRLLDARPDVLIVQATTPTEERAAHAALDGALEALRTLAVPVLAVIGPAGGPPSDLMIEVDDVLAPPYDAAELVLRAALIARRRGTSAGRLVTAGPLTVDVEGFRAWLAAEPLTLTYTEFQLLRLLLLNRGKVLTRQVLLNKIWGYDYLGGLRTVDVHIRRLRAKLEAQAPTLIETVRHVGYRIGD